MYTTQKIYIIVRNQNFLLYSSTVILPQPLYSSIVILPQPLQVSLFRCNKVCIPPEALQPIWLDSYRKSWGMKLHKSSSAEDVLQVLTLLEGAIKRDFLSPKFQTTNGSLSLGKKVEYAVYDASNFGTIAVLPWIPQTTSAVALRLMELDSAVAYLPEQKIEYAKDAEAEKFLRLPSKYTIVRNIQDDEFGGLYGDDAWLDRGSELVEFTSSRGGRGRGRGRVRGGGRSQRRVVGSRGEPSRRSLASNERLRQDLGGWKSQSSRGKGGGRKSGRRSARSRQRPVKKTPAVSLPGPIPYNKSPPGSYEWNTKDTRKMQGANEDSISDYNDDNGQTFGEEYDDDMAVDTYTSGYNGNPCHLEDENVYNGEEDEDDDGDCDEDGDDVGGNYEQGDMDVGGFLNHEYEEDEGNQDENRQRNEDQDDTSDSVSTEYSSSSSSD